MKIKRVASVVVEPFGSIRIFIMVMTAFIISKILDTASTYYHFSQPGSDISDEINPTGEFFLGSLGAIERFVLMLIFPIIVFVLLAVLVFYLFRLFVGVRSARFFVGVVSYIAIFGSLLAALSNMGFLSPVYSVYVRILKVFFTDEFLINNSEFFMIISLLVILAFLAPVVISTLSLLGFGREKSNHFSQQKSKVES